LDDITLRALQVLERAEIIAAEDTRHTRKLLSHHGIRTAKLVAYHEHNEHLKAPQLLARLEEGQTLALVSNAGTPLISDPGYRLVEAAGRQGLPVIPIPGPTACGAALSVSGLPTDQFIFLGFMPRKPGSRKKILTALAADSRTMIFYESPRRICTLMTEIAELWGERMVLCAREMTKLHEEYLRGPLTQVTAELTQRERIRGEITLVVAGAPVGGDDNAQGEVEHLLRKALSEPDASLSRAVQSVAQSMNVSRRRVYQIALRIQRDD
jgi:16S rRNA (cytidine1402-2'-O)-methyltransferase